MKTFGTKIALLILSCGWIFPLWIGVDSIDLWVRTELISAITQEPKLYGLEPNVVSFEAYETGVANIRVGLVWLALASILWCVWYLRGANVSKQDHSK